MAGNRNKRSCVDEGALEWYNPTIQYQRHAKGVHSLQCFKVPFAEMQMALFLFCGHYNRHRQRSCKGTLFLHRKRHPPQTDERRQKYGKGLL